MQLWIDYAFVIYVLSPYKTNGAASGTIKYTVFLEGL